MKLKFLNSRNDNPSYIVRLLLPLGVYPDKLINTNDSILYVSEEICFSIAPYSAEIIDSDYYSEVEWATLNEIKLYASIVLSVAPGEGYLNMYPFMYAHYLDLNNISEVSNKLDEIKHLLIKEINTPKNGSKSSIYKNNKESFVPTICGGFSYDLREKDLRSEIQRDIYSKFKTSNHLLIRGVSTLLRSRMLSRHLHFMEEAINATFISLEASFRLVLNELKSQGTLNPSSRDAAKYIASVFLSEATGKYFEEYYDSRIMSFHPESRFGIFPHAPLAADDHFDLFDNLSEVYTYLISGYINPKYKLNSIKYAT